MKILRSQLHRPGFKPCGCSDGDCDTCHPKIYDLINDVIEELERVELFNTGNRNYVSMERSTYDLICEEMTHIKKAILKYEGQE